SRQRLREAWVVGERLLHQPVQSWIVECAPPGLPCRRHRRRREAETLGGDCLLRRIDLRRCNAARKAESQGNDGRTKSVHGSWVSSFVTASPPSRRSDSRSPRRGSCYRHAAAGKSPG